MTSVPALERAVEGRVVAEKYRLESLLGEGGMGSVWRAFNLQLEVPVALKLLRSDVEHDGLEERLRVEARAAAKLVHPSIVRVFDIGEADWGEPFIVMELLVGESLTSLLQRGPLSCCRALQLLLPIAEALSLAHSRGVVHRDLKPDNIFFAEEGSAIQPKLLDFGIAKVTSAAATGATTLTQAGTLLGSPDYMSPEQAYGQSDIDERSDIWSFCVVLYEAIAGRPPFLGDTYQNVLANVVATTPPSLASLADVDPALAQLIEGGLAKDRALRPSSIFELGQALARWLLSQGVTEDVTGSSVEAKWLGRSQDSPAADPAPSVRLPSAQHEHATLVSLVHPPWVTSVPPARRRAPLRAVAVGLAVLAVGSLAAFGIAWQNGSLDKNVWAASRVETLPTPPPPAPPPPASPTGIIELAPPPTSDHTVTTLPVVTIDAGEGQRQEAMHPAKGQRPITPKRSTPFVSTQPASNHPAPEGDLADPASLPRALPSRSSRVDLLNPY